MLLDIGVTDNDDVVNILKHNNKNLIQLLLH